MKKVKHIGTIGLLDLLYLESKITEDEYLYCINSFINTESPLVRLPKEELYKRLNKSELEKILEKVKEFNNENE